jgi:hypothetical protein
VPDKKHTAGGVMPLCDEWLALIRKTKQTHSAAEGCQWLLSDEELLYRIKLLFEQAEICKAA